jgi:hypothetical protein
MVTRVNPEEPHDPASCGCGAHGDANGVRRPAVVDAAVKSRNFKRLRRIEGQVRGLQKMVEEDRYCADIMTNTDAEAMYDELIDLVYTRGR